MNSWQNCTQISLWFVILVEIPFAFRRVENLKESQSTGTWTARHDSIIDTVSELRGKRKRSDGGDTWECRKWSFPVHSHHRHFQPCLPQGDTFVTCLSLHVNAALISSLEFYKWISIHFCFYFHCYLSSFLISISISSFLPIPTFVDSISTSIPSWTSHELITAE